VFNALDCTDGDYKALFALGLLYAINHNNGKRPVSLPTIIDQNVVVVFGFFDQT